MTTQDQGDVHQRRGYAPGLFLAGMIVRRHEDPNPLYARGILGPCTPCPSFGRRCDTTYLDPADLNARVFYVCIHRVVLRSALFMVMRGHRLYNAFVLEGCR
jgi:hypothetical protein